MTAAEPPQPQGPPQLQPVGTLAGHSDDINAVAWNPDGQRIATGSDDDSIRIWDLAGNLLESLTPGHTDDVLSLAWDATGNQLASTSADGSAIIWSVVSGQPPMVALRASMIGL